MEDDYNRNQRDESEERFIKMEEHVSNISHNMNILMVALERKFGPFGEFGTSKL
jgi:hypothetical protein